MLFAIDIDGTIANDDRGRAYARYLNRELALGVSDETIERLKSYATFIQLEQVQAYAAESEEHKAHYRAAIRQAQHDPEVQQAAIPLPGAVEGVAALARYGEIIYVTCRKPESFDRTRDWLSSYRFAQPDRIYICKHYHFKYIYASQLAHVSEPIVLIDDHAEDVVKFFQRLVKEHYAVAKSIRKRLAVVAFGCQEAPPCPFKQPLFPVLALPSWDKNVLEQLIGPVDSSIVATE